MPPPRDLWNDKAIEQLAETIRALGPAVGQVLRIEAEVDAAGREREQLRTLIGEIRTELLEAINDVGKRLDRFEDSRRTIVLGMLGFGGCVSAALIGAAAVLISHFA